MIKDSKIYIAGHRGMAGSAIVRRLENDGFSNLVMRTHAELDLQNQVAVEAFFEQEKPEYVFLAAAKVGGIHANNTYPADFLRDNIQIQTNVIDTAYRHGVRKLLFLGSSCIYPRDCPQPIKEKYLLNGPLEPTNEWYAIAKIAGIKMCQAYKQQFGFNAICAMPTNLYGPGDNYDLETSHVLGALIRKFSDAVAGDSGSVDVWGSGKPRREFLHVDDLADACVLLMQQYNDPAIVNVGSGSDLSIAELAEMIAKLAGFHGRIDFDPNRPDGTPRKLLDTSRMQALGWTPGIDLESGLRRTLTEYAAIR